MGSRGAVTSPFYPSGHFYSAIALFAVTALAQLLLARGPFDLVIALALLVPAFDTSLFLLLRLKVLTSARQVPPPVSVPSTLPVISFILPSYQEPLDVKKMTLDSLLAVRYPGQVEVISVDNSPDTTTLDHQRWRDYLTELGILFLHNDDPAASKPGNIELALTRATGEFVLFVDVDSTLPADPGFLLAALHEFAADPSLGYVQFHIAPTNAHFNQLTRGTARYLHLHNAVEVVSGQGGFAMFKGHNAIWRRSALDASGRWHDELGGRTILAEDLLKALGAYRNGCHGRITWQVTGEWVPCSLRAFTSMWQRWIYGTLQVVAKVRPSDVLRARELTVFEKVEIFRRIKFGTFVVPYLAFVLAAVFPRPVLIPYLVLLGLTVTAGLVVGARLDTPGGWRTHVVAAMAELYVHMIGFAAQLRFMAHRLNRSADGLKWTTTPKRAQHRPGFVDSLRCNGSVYLSQGLLLLVTAVLLITDPGGPAAVFLRVYALSHFLTIVLMPLFLGRTTRTADNLATVDPPQEVTDAA